MVVLQVTFEFPEYLQKYENHLHTISENITMEKRLTTKKDNFHISKMISISGSRHCIT